MKQLLNKLTLKWKIFAYLLGFCAILLFILWMFQTVLLDSFYRGIKVMEIKNNTGIIVNNIDSENLSDLITAIAQNGEVSIEIINDQGVDLFSTDGTNTSHTISFQEKMDIIDRAQAQNGEYIKYTLEEAAPKPTIGGFSSKIPADSIPSRQSIVYAKIVTTSSGSTEAILMSSQISPVNATVTTLRYQLYLITAVMIMLAVFLALLIARRVSKPIEEINKSAKELAAGNYNIQFNGKGFREIGELSDTLNKAAADLSKVEGLRRELMANISHDMRTPLALIYSYAEVMHDFPEEITANQTQIIMDETQRLTSLVNDVMDISKLESGTQELSISEFNLTKSIDETTKRLAELVKKEGYALTFNYTGDVLVLADETKITQVYYNLLLNAIHYTGKDKTIAVSQAVTNDTVRIEVTDTGEGIAPEEQAYIWDRYYKIDKKHKRPVTGTGLGLSIVSKIIKLHGGNCGVDSTVGKGSTFWFSLKISL
jgi:signal transduction histidine kinase